MSTTKSKKAATDEEKEQQLKWRLLIPNFDSEISRIYGPEGQAVHVREAITGTMPVPTHTRRAVRFDVADVRWDEHRQREDFLAANDRRLKQQFSSVATSFDTPNPIEGGTHLSKGEIEWLARKLPQQEAELEARRSKVEEELYKKRVRYRGEMGKGYQPWQMEAVEMCRGIVYELVDLVLDMYRTKTVKHSIVIQGTSKILGLPAGRTAFVSFDKATQLESECVAMEQTRNFVQEIASNEFELSQLCRDWAITKSVQTAWKFSQDDPKKSLQELDSSTFAKLREFYFDKKGWKVK